LYYGADDYWNWDDTNNYLNFNADGGAPDSRGAKVLANDFYLAAEGVWLSNHGDAQHSVDYEEETHASEHAGNDLDYSGDVLNIESTLNYVTNITTSTLTVTGNLTVSGAVYQSGNTAYMVGTKTGSNRRLEYGSNDCNTAGAQNITCTVTWANAFSATPVCICDTRGDWQLREANQSACTTTGASMVVTTEGATSFTTICQGFGY